MPRRRYGRINERGPGGLPADSYTVDASTCDICFGPLPCPRHTPAYIPTIADVVAFAPQAPWRMHPTTIRVRNMRRFGRTAYQVLAQTMQEAHGTEPLSGTAELMWTNTVLRLAATLENDSSYFQPERFITACQPGANTAQAPELHP
jgi:hypothetical protein